MKQHRFFSILCSLAFAAIFFTRSIYGAASGEPTASIIGAEQGGHRVVLLKPNADWSRSESILWEWKAGSAPEILPDHVSWFNHVSEVKPVHGTDALLCAASGGGVALVRLNDQKVLFYAYAGGNTHSAALLPDGNIVSASSTGGYLRLFVAPEVFTAADAIESADYPLTDAHGVVWDSKRQTLWALGGEELVGYSYTGPKESPTLAPIFRLPLSEKLQGGHDLYPMPGGDALFVTGNCGVGLFDPAQRTLAEVLDVEHVKSISLDGTGRLLVQIPEEQWWSATLRYLDPARSAAGTLPGARFYKARWWLPNTFSSEPAAESASAPASEPVSAPADAVQTGPLDWKVGVSVGGFRKNTPGAETLKKIKSARFDLVELSLASEGASWSEEEQLKNLLDFKSACDEARIELWSIHLPFSGALDISLADDAKRQAMLDLAVRLMDWNSLLGAKVFVIHPSSEPIADADRLAREKRCIESLKFLGAEAAKRKIRLAVEDLPRTCLLRDSDETNRILGAAGENVTLVFDSNHLLKETPEEYLARLNPAIQISTTHISDYDGLDEKHWAPYEGIIRWKKVVGQLVERQFPGPFVFEGAGRPNQPGLDYDALYERWEEVRDEFLYGIDTAEIPPARALWPVDELLNEPVAWEKAGEPNGRVTPIFYDGALYQGKPTKVFAYLGQPEGAGPFPAILLIHGGGGAAFPDWAQYWADRGFVALAMDLAGCGADGQRHDAAGPDQSDESKFRDFSSDDYTDVWTWQAIAAILRGHALLKSLDHVDSSRIAATGISWGGYLTSILSGVDRQIACFVPVYGCGFLHENSAWKEAFFDAMTPEQRKRWVALFDPSSHLPRSSKPMLWVNGSNDFAYPLDSYQKCYRLPSGSRTLAIAVPRPHGHIWTFPEVDAFIDNTLKIGDSGPLISVTAPEINGDTLSVKVVGDEKPVAAELYWTSDTGRWQEKKWESAPAAIDGDTVSAAVPSSAKCVFLNLTDSRGLVVSSEHIER